MSLYRVQPVVALPKSAAKSKQCGSARSRPHAINNVFLYTWARRLQIFLEGNFIGTKSGVVGCNGYAGRALTRLKRRLHQFWLGSEALDQVLTK